MSRLCAYALSLLALSPAGVAFADTPLDAVVDSSFLGSPYWMWAALAAGGALIFLALFQLHMRSKYRHLQLALDYASDSVYLIDEKARFVYVNEAACRTLGYSRAELLSMGVADIDIASSSDVALAVRKRTLEDGAFAFETQHRRHDGSLVDVEVHASTLRNGGKLIGLAFARDISARKRTERELQLLQLAINQTGEALYIQDTSLRFINVNDAACRMLGYTRDELLAMGPTDIDPDASREIIEQAFRTKEVGKPHSFESRHRTRDGRIFPVEISGTFFDVSGARYVVTMVRDITERKRALQQMELLERAVCQSGDTVLLLDSDAHIRYVNETACHILGYSRDELLAMTPPDIDPDMTLEKCLGMTRSGTGAMRIFESRHRAKDGRIFPVEVSGVSFERDGERFTLVTARDITARKRMENELKRHEREFRSLAENLPDHVARWDMEGRYLYINPAHEHLLGIPLTRIIGQPTSSSVMQIQEGIARVIATGKMVTLERVPVPARNGGLLLHDVKLVPERDDAGRVVSVLGLGRNMTDTYRMETELRAQAEFQRVLLDAIDEVGLQLMLIEQGKVVYFNNQQRAREFGLSESEIEAGVSLLDHIHPSDRARIADMHRRRLAGEAVENSYEFSMQTPAGERKEYELYVTTVPGTDPVRTVAIMRDISERKRMVTELAEREHAFRSLAESSPDNIIRYDRSGRVLYLNNNLVHTLKLSSADELIGKRPGEIWPDGRFSSLEKAAAEAAASGDMVSIELVMPSEGNDLVYNHIYVVPERDMDGNIVGTLAFGRDVTQMREAEMRLRHFAETLPGITYTFRLAADGRASFPYVSPAIREMYGLEPSDVKDDFRPIHDLAHPDDRPVIEAAIAESARTLQPFHVETRVCRPGMAERWQDVRSVPERQPDGSILWYGIMLDITDRKQMQLALEESRGQLRGLLAQRENAREEERKLIAREVHDELGQILTGLKMNIAVISMQASSAAPQLSELIAEAKTLLEYAIGAVRNITSTVRAVELDMGIAAALEWQANRFRTYTGVQCRVQVAGGLPEPDKQLSVAIFRIVQESLTNAAKYAGAKSVEVSLVLDAADYVLRVKDDGCGFDINARKAGAFGLFGMQERALMLGGGLSIHSGPGSGTEIVVRFPMDMGKGAV